MTRPEMIYGFFYRLLMRLAHRHNWHYAPPCYPEGDTMLWCHWCGFRAIVKHGPLRHDMNSGIGMASGEIKPIDLAKALEQQRLLNRTKTHAEVPDETDRR